MEERPYSIRLFFLIFNRLRCKSVLYSIRLRRNDATSASCFVGANQFTGPEVRVEPRLARHGTIEKMGRPHRPDMCAVSTGGEQCVMVVSLLKLKLWRWKSVGGLRAGGGVREGSTERV